MLQLCSRCSRYNGRRWLRRLELCPSTTLCQPRQTQVSGGRSVFRFPVSSFMHRHKLESQGYGLVAVPLVDLRRMGGLVRVPRQMLDMTTHRLAKQLCKCSVSTLQLTTLHYARRVVQVMMQHFNFPKRVAPWTQKDKSWRCRARACLDARVQELGNARS
jgi:hypothetical protein